MLATIFNVPAAELNDWNPDRFDAVRNPDGTYNLVPVLWWDEASYAAYQGDPYGDLPPAE